MAILGEEVADAYISIHGDSTAFKADVKKLQVLSKKLFSQLGEETGEEFEEGFSKTVTKTNSKTKKAINTSFLGRLKGSRNDALNAIGSIGGAFENLVSGTLTKGFKIMGDLTSTIGGKLLNVGEGAGALQGPLNVLGANLVKAGGALSATSATGIGLVVILAVLAASFFATGIAVALLTTLLSSLLAIATALVASAFFALAGIILALGPAALAAAAGVGALVAAFAGMDDETKKAFEPLKAALDVLQKKVRGALFTNLKTQLKDIKDILNTFVAPLLIAAAGALSTVFTNLLDAFQSPAVKATLDIFTATLPTILLNLGNALNNFLIGILNFFAPISTAMEPLSGKILEIAEAFRLWTEKPENMAKITEFFDAAVASTDTWLALIGPLSTAVLGLFSQGKETGDGFITSLVGIITKFAEWVQSEEGRQQIKDWFDQAKIVAGQLADIIGDVSEAIVALDTPENRKALTDLLGAVSDITDAAETMSGWFQDVPRLIRLISGQVFLIPGLSAMVGLVDTLIKGLKWVADHMPGGGATKTFGGSGTGGGGGALAQKRGGILNSPTQILAGEAGREMVVPLVRPLSQVDASVRAVSAFARGMDSSSFNSGFNNNQPGKVVNIQSGAVQFTAPTDDPDQVANAVLDRLVARWK